MGAFEAFYASSLQHPWLLWLSAAVAGASCAVRPDVPPSARRYAIGLTLLSLADAWLTSSPVYGVGALGETAGSLVPLGFVLAGDLRFLLLFDAATPAGAVRPTVRGLAVAAALTAVVPLSSQVVLHALPSAADGPRALYLVYEALFLLLTLALLRWHPRVDAVPWLVPVGRFVALYYALWAGADALVLSGAREAGFALRVVPNVLYYGGLIAVIGRSSAAAASNAVADR